MSSRVEVPVGIAGKARAGAIDAILSRGRRHFVFVVGEQNLAEQRPVSVGVSAGSQFEVERGIQAGDLVITRGNERIQPGMPVRIVPGKTKTAQNAQPPAAPEAKTP